MPHKLFRIMLITVLTFFVLTVITLIFSASVGDDEGMYSLVFDKNAEEGGILHLDLALVAKLAIQWFNILLLTFFLMHILYNPVRKFMIDRAERIKNDIESAQRNNADSRDMKEKYEGLLAEINKTRDEILNKAHREANEEHERIIFEAQEERTSLLQRADEEIKLERENATAEVRRQIIEIATLMAARFVEVSIDGATQDKYIDEALNDWSDRTWQA